MKRLLFSGFAGCFVICGAFACDPDLTLRTIPGDAGSDGGPVTTTSPEGGTTESEGGTDEEGGTSSEGGASEGGTAPAHVIDGINDFKPGETLATTSPLYEGYVTWDATNVYFGMQGSDVGANSSSKWVLIYVDGNPGNSGTAQGLSYDCSGTCTSQVANLAFSAGYHLRWKSDGSYTNLQKWNGTAWTNVGPISTVKNTGDFMELSITRTTLGNPTKLKVDMFMLIEQSGAEWTYSGVPSTAFTDGKAPAAIAKYFDFDLSDMSTAPNTYSPLP